MKNLMTRLQFLQKDAEYLEKCYKKMTATHSLRQALLCATDLFFGKEERAYESELDKISKSTGIHRYTVDLVFLLLCARPLKYIYHVTGLSEKIYYDTLLDLRVKLEECKRVYKIIGVFVGWWYRPFYVCNRFALGRMEYEKILFPFDEYKGIIKKGDTVYSCHIPSLGPLSPQMVIDSLKTAYVFYEKELKNGILPVYCSSYLLHHQTAQCYPDGSNLRSFYDLFDIIQSIDDEENKDFWRIFDCEFNADALETVPTRTTLQKGIKLMLQKGQSMGKGRGILLFDGEKILQK